jgi:hypothetical protein
LLHQIWLLKIQHLLEKKGTTSTKASLNNDVSLCALLDSTNEDKNDIERKHRIKFNRIHVRNYVGNQIMTDLQCNEHIRLTLGAKSSRAQTHSLSSSDQ